MIGDEMSSPSTPLGSQRSARTTATDRKTTTSSPIVRRLHCIIGLLITAASGHGIIQKMNQLRLEADESNAKVEELQSKVKLLEQENLSKEQEITSLQHKNGVLEGELEKLEENVKNLKKMADENVSAGTQNENLARRLQLLEDEAEEADKTLREANEK